MQMDFYDKNQVLRRGAETDFIYYLRKIFNRVKLTEILLYESAENLEVTLDLITKHHLESRDTSAEEVASLFNKPKGDDGTYYLLQNLSILSVLTVNLYLVQNQEQLSTISQPTISTNTHQDYTHRQRVMNLTKGSHNFIPVKETYLT
jgi:hypothetical protein